MTKKKKTLRAAVLASIFAMAFSATAWAEIYDNSNYADKWDSTHRSGSVMPDYTEYDNYNQAYFAYNPKLTDCSGTVAEDGNKDNETGNFEPRFNYYLQAFAYGAGEIASELFVERIVGVKMNEGGEATQDLNQYGIENKIDVSGVQLFHVEYTSTGGTVSPDYLDVADGKISLAQQIHKKDSQGNFLYIDNETGEETTNQYTNDKENIPVKDTVMHYCGESAKSVSIGQLQRMNEVFYNNDLNLSEGIADEAQERYEADQRINVEYNET